MNIPLSHCLQKNSELRQQIARRERVENVLLATKRRLKRLLASSPAVIYSSQASNDYGIVFVSESIQQFGYKQQDFLENIGLWKQCIHPDDMSSVLEALRQLQENSYCCFEYRFLHKEGNYRWIQDHRNLICNELGKPIEIIGSWQDITDQKDIEQALFHGRELAHNILQSIGDGVITTNASGVIVYLNPAAEQIMGLSVDAVKGTPLSTLFKSSQDDDSPYILELLLTAKSSRKVMQLPPDTLFVTRGGVDYIMDGSLAPIRDRTDQVTGSVIVFRDITQHQVLARQLSWQASHDFLTGLVNRREFEKRLMGAIASAREDDQQHTLCYLDLDQFKVVNDTCGHEAGDELLRQLSALLRDRLRSSDILARIGGDEFGIVFNNCPLGNAIDITDHLLRNIQGFRFSWQKNTFTVGASAGLVSIDADCGDLNSVLGAADAACFAAKNRGRNRLHVYQIDDRELVQQRGERRWVARILKALEEERFRLYRQAIVPVTPNSREETYYELLLRMIDEDGKTVPPMAFIPAAERYGLMPTLDRWVISHFLSQYQNYASLAFANAPCPHPLYTINLSGMSINDDNLSVFLAEQFMHYDISPQNICFEITETAAIANLSAAAELIQDIKKLGCAFALDDFGSGMSSFAYLKTLPVDYVKIDGSFIRNILSDKVDSTMVECMTRIGHELGIQTIAEFVENGDILKKLQDLGVDYAQGYGIGIPHPLHLDGEV